MNDPISQVLGHMPGVLVRQRLRLKNLCVCTLKNKYDVGEFPQGLDVTQPWSDDIFKQQQGLLLMNEESECCDKICCLNYRKFRMGVHLGHNKGDPEILRFDRPFKCPLVCCCYMPWPQEIRTSDPRTNAPLGHVQQDWRCLEAICGKQYWKVYDASGTVTHVIRRDICCNSNMCAPSCCCEIHRLDITDPSEQAVVGSIENIFPGCSCRTLCCGNLIDNYRLTFPTNATPHQKANLLAGLILVDYMVFSNVDEDKNRNNNSN